MLASIGQPSSSQNGKVREHTTNIDFKSRPLLMMNKLVATRRDYGSWVKCVIVINLGPFQLLKQAKQDLWFLPGCLMSCNILGNANMALLPSQLLSKYLSSFLCTECRERLRVTDIGIRSCLASRGLPLLCSCMHLERAAQISHGHNE